MNNTASDFNDNLIVNQTYFCILTINNTFQIILQNIFNSGVSVYWIENIFSSILSLSDFYCHIFDVLITKICHWLEEKTENCHLKYLMH